MVPRMAAAHVAANPSAMPIAIVAAIFNARRIFLPGPVVVDYAVRLRFANLFTGDEWNELTAVGAGRGAGLAMSLRTLVGIAAIHRGVLGVGIGAAARRERQIPAAPPVISDEGRQRHAFLPGEGHEIGRAS